jgi:hypothetical protein
MTAIPPHFGGDLNENRSALVKELVVVKGSYVVITAPISPLGRDQKVVTLAGGVETRDALREVLHQLLTAVAHDVQDRFSIQRRDSPRSGTAATPPYDPDVVIGPDLAQHIQTAKAHSRESA